jgi:hypothetical protein
VPGSPPPRSEWPKKLRALTQQDLDRLTIDQEGRFYWDGKLVTSTVTHAVPNSTTDAEPKALEMLDRAAAEIAGRKPADSADVTRTPAPEPAEVPTSATPAEAAIADTTVDLPTATLPARGTTPASRASVDGRVRLSLSATQSVGAMIIALALLACAAGLAVTGWAVAHEWTCRLGWVKACPGDMGTKPPAPKVSDIPT